MLLSKNAVLGLLMWAIMAVTQKDCLALGTEAGKPGLYAENGMLMREGKPYRGIGINYFDVFTRMIGAEGKPATETTATLSRNLELLTQYQIPFIRFNAAGFYPVDWALYQQDRQQYFAIFDALVAEAELRKIGLIPSLNFVHFAIPDLMGEPLDQWGNLESKTIAFMRHYAKEVVGRYKDSPAIWAWEFGNEYMLEADLLKVTGKVHALTRVDLGNPAQRSERDGLTRQHVRTAYVDFARTVRELDPHRVIITGDAQPRRAAYHNMTEGTWEPDTPEQAAEVLLGDNPDPIDTISIHFYPHNDLKKPNHGVEGMTIVENLKFYHEISQKAGKPLFVGEFAASSNQADAGLRRSQQMEVFDALIEARVPLAAFWVYDLFNQPENSVTPTKDLYVLEKIRDINRDWALQQAESE